MRLLMYRDGSGAHLGALREDRIIDLAALVAANGGGTVPSTLLALIDAGPEELQRIRTLLDRGDLGQYSAPLAGAAVLPPLDPPRGNVLAIGRNYQEHAAESAQARGEEVMRPTAFTKAQTAVTGPYDDVAINERITQQVDWEAELGVVIGQRALNVSRERALEYVFGYTVVNDLSARDVQYGWGGQFFKGKSLDGFCPTGPWIVTADEVPDPQALRVRCKVNGVVKQDDTTANMIFPVDELIAQLSDGMTLPAGTLIATGTPAGVGFARKPPEYLRPGDVVEAEIEGIGALHNRVAAAS